jgi:di/tripeptidase
MNYSDNFKRLNIQAEIISRFQAKNILTLNELRHEKPIPLISADDANAEYAAIEEIKELIWLAREKRIPLKNIINSLKGAPTPSDYTRGNKHLAVV